MRILKKAYFTLIEILVVMSLILLIGGVIAINVRNAVFEQRFRTEVELIVDTIRLAQDIMLIVGADIHFYMKQKSADKGIEYWIESVGGLPKEWDPIVARNHRVLTAVHSANFSDERFPRTEGILDIRFESEGTMMSLGVLRLSPYPKETTEGPLKVAICLPGYPHPIISQWEGKTPITCSPPNAEFDMRLTNQTVSEIIEDVPPEQQSQENSEETPSEPSKKPEKTKPNPEKEPG